MAKTKVSVERITPTQAKRLLEGNTQNRNLRKRVITQYANDMRAGMWSDQGDPIRLGSDDTLLDGQHRLHAIIESGRPQQMVVVRNVAKSSILTMDTGAKRTFADVLRLHGYKNTAVLAAAARFCWLHERGLDTRHKDALSNSALMAWITEHDDMPFHVERIQAASNQRPVVRALRTPLVGIREFGGDRSEVDTFVERLRSGTELTDGHPVHTLKRTMENYLMSTSLRLAPVVTQAITVKAWNAYVRGEDVHVLRFKPGGSTPETFPRIEQA